MPALKIFDISADSCTLESISTMKGPKFFDLSLDDDLDTCSEVSPEDDDDYWTLCPDDHSPVSHSSCADEVGDCTEEAKPDMSQSCIELSCKSPRTIMMHQQLSFLQC